jgi:F-box domain
VPTITWWRFEAIGESDADFYFVRRLLHSNYIFLFFVFVQYCTRGSYGLLTKPFYQPIVMPSIPVDVLREILEHVDKNDLATLCRVNKIFCSCSQDVLYRDIGGNAPAIQTIVQSTDLARRARSFGTFCDFPELGTALRNMSSLRSLNLWIDSDVSILDGCTFKLDSFSNPFPNSESLQKFLNGQPSLTNISLFTAYIPSPPFDERSLPNLTRVEARPSWLRILIPGRPVTDVSVWEYQPEEIIDFSFFTLSTAPIHSLHIPYDNIYPTPGSYLAYIFPSIVNLVLGTYELNWSVRRQLTVIGVLMKKSTIIGLVGL